MDMKRFLTPMLIALVTMGGYVLFVSSQRGNAAPAAATATASAPAPVAMPPTVPISTVTLGGSGAADTEKLEIVVSTFTAGIDLVQLNVKDYPETVKGKEPFTLMQVDPPAAKPFATLRVTVNGTGVDLSKWVWPIESSSRDEVRLAIKLGDVAVLRKIIKIDPTSYDVTISHEVENLTDKPVSVSVDQLGPTDLAYDSMQVDPRSFSATAINSARLFIEPGKKLVDQLTAARSGHEPLGTFKGTDHLVWVAAMDRFFAVIVRPTGGPDVPSTTENIPTGAIVTPDFAGEASVEKLGERPLPASTDTWKITGIQLLGNTVTIPAKGKTTMPLAVFMGPKQRGLLAGSPDAAVGTEKFNYFLYVYQKIIKYGRGLCTFLTFDWLVLFILATLDVVHKYVTFGNYGLAIILLVIVVRLLLHPLTRFSQVSMTTMQKKMAAIGPELDAVKKRYAKDKQQQQAAIMKVYKENNVNPAAPVMGCLPMLLQMPIWLALYSGLAADIDLRHASFIPGWITDLSDPDTVAMAQTSFSVPILGVNKMGMHFIALNVLPILLALVFFIQMKVQAKTMPKPADEQQAQTQKISQYMILLFPLFLYTAPSGLNVYIFASTVGGLFDTWLVRRHMRAKGLLPEVEAK